MSEENKNQENVQDAAEAAAGEQKPAEAAAGEQPAAETATKEEKPKVELSANMETVVKTVESMTVLELSELVKALEDRFGVSAAAPMAAVAMPGAGAAGGAAAEAEEKTIFSVVLESAGSNKIQVIKEVRALTNLGLKEAKDLVEGAPKEVKTDVPKEEAEKMKKQLEDAGAKVALK